MKLNLFFSAVFVVSSAIAAPPTKIESVIVKDIRQSGNLFPGPGRRNRVRSVLSVEAMSQGCTKSDDFEVQVKDASSFQEVTIVRKNDDPCDRVPAKQSFDLETDRLIPSFRKGIRVLNPLIVEEHFIH